MRRPLTVASVTLCAAVQAEAALVVRNLQVEHGTTPLGIDVTEPRFAWQLSATGPERGVVQSACGIEV